MRRISFSKVGINVQELTKLVLQILEADAGGDREYGPQKRPKLGWFVLVGPLNHTPQGVPQSITSPTVIFM